MDASYAKVFIDGMPEIKLMLEQGTDPVQLGLIAVTLVTVILSTIMAWRHGNRQLRHQSQQAMAQSRTAWIVSLRDTVSGFIAACEKMLSMNTHLRYASEHEKMAGMNALTEARIEAKRLQALTEFHFNRSEEKIDALRSRMEAGYKAAYDGDTSLFMQQSEGIVQAVRSILGEQWQVVNDNLAGHQPAKNRSGVRRRLFRRHRA